MRNAISIGIPFAVQPWILHSGLQNMFIISGFVCLAISGLIIPMIIYGKRIRAIWAEKYRRFAGDSGVNI
jgi:peroxiredoxin